MLKTQDKIIKSIISFLLALLLAVLFRSLLYEPFHIPSGSMNPTLVKGDYILVSKYAYGYSRYSFPFAFPIFGKNIRIMYKEPKRGDVLVFRLPKKPEINYIKRVIGLPGDRVQIKNGLLYINDISVKMSTAANCVEDDGSSVRDCYLETLDNGVEHSVITRFFGRRYRDTEVYNVPDGHLFVMGDNRDNSTDSRFLNDVGFIPIENLVGRAEVVVLSLSGDAVFFLNLNFHRIWKCINCMIKSSYSFS